MLILNNIMVAFGNNTVLSNLSATVKPGDFITIIGSNGAGKSTLFDVITGKIRPTIGTVTIDGVDVSRMGELDRTKFVAHLFQNPLANCAQDMTVAQNLALATMKGRRLGFRCAMKNLQNAFIDEVLKPMIPAINELLDVKMELLSGGQRQLIALIMATINPPKILLLDEPTAALDPIAATNLLIFAQQFIAKHKITTLLITHDINLAQAMGNKLWVLENGCIEKVYEDEKKYLLTKTSIKTIDYAVLEHSKFTV